MEKPLPPPTIPTAAAVTTTTIFPRFLTTQPETLRLKKQDVFSGSFGVQLANGTPLLHVQAQVASFQGRKDVYDGRGTLVCSIVQERMHFVHATYVVEDGAGREVMRVRKRRRGVKLWGSKATATVTLQDGKQRELVLRGNFFDTQADVVDEEKGLVLARIDRKFFSGRIIFSRKTYTVQVAPGVDLVLIAALCMCLDEMNNDGKR